MFQHFLQADAGLIHVLDGLFHMAVIYYGKHFGKAEKAHKSGDRADAGAQLLDAEHKARRACQRVKADHADDQAERCSGEALGIVPAGHGADGHQTKERQQEIIHRPEPDGNSRDRTGQHRQRRKAEKAADKGIDRGHIQRLIRFAAPCQRIAIQRRHH